MKYSILLTKYVPSPKGRKGKIVDKRVIVEAEDIITACETAKSQYNFSDVSMVYPVV